MKIIPTLIAAVLVSSTASLASPALQEVQDRLALAEIPTEIEQAVDRKDWDHARRFSLTKSVSTSQVLSAASRRPFRPRR